MKVKSNENFFDEISVFYDEMVNLNSAFERRKNVLSNLISSEIKNVADLGCGSGLDSISLANLGFKVEAFDLSAKMISRAKQNAKNAGVKVKFHKSSLDKIPTEFKNKFDAAVSLGNTLANLDKKKLALAVKNASKILNDKGIFLVQILNYSGIISANERIININENDSKMFVRFYDFYPEHLNFNVLTVNKNNLKEKELYTTKLFAHTKKEFEEILKKNGFTKIKFFGGFNKSKFEPKKSKDLVILAEK